MSPLVGPSHPLVQATAVSILMMGQVLYLLLQLPRLTLMTPEGMILCSLWLFHALMAVHWWYGGLYFLQHLGPAKTLPSVYFFFALLGTSIAPMMFIHDQALYMGTFAVSFLLAFVRYRTLLPTLAPGSGVREYVRKKAHVEAAGFAMLGWGAISGVVITDPRLQAVMAATAVLIQTALIVYCVKKLYPLAEADASAVTGAAVVSLAKAS
ncbi:MAG: hypothetical protein M3Y59_05715 [Myxococcota bacterium]|nr:hypothetical protein [Myxococcota bacterium]